MLLALTDSRSIPASNRRSRCHLFVSLFQQYPFQASLLLGKFHKPHAIPKLFLQNHCNRCGVISSPSTHTRRTWSSCFKPARTFRNRTWGDTFMDLYGTVRRSNVLRLHWNHLLLLTNSSIVGRLDMLQ